MKILIYGHESIGFKVPARLFNKYIKACIAATENKEAQEYIVKIEEIKEEIRQTCKSFTVDYIATGDY